MLNFSEKTYKPYKSSFNSGSFFFQPKLNINKPDDIYEQEADAMADKVMRMSPGINDPPFFSSVVRPDIQRMCSDCEEEENLQRKEKPDESSNNFIDDGYISNVINSGGNRLTTGERKFFEPRFGYDFSDVRIHTDTAAARSAQSINALAYTSGKNIVFNENQYSPETDNGKKLLAHELTHVVQQGSGQINKHTISRKTKECDPDRELTWADYKGSIPKGVTWAAMTRSGPIEVDDNGGSLFQGFFDPGNSWAQEKYIHASDNSKNGCGKIISDCENFMKGRKKPGEINPIRSGKCPASIDHDKVTVNNAAECKTKFGPECKRAREADSKLLLIHEALHFKISCELSKKGNKELAKGKTFKDVFKKVKEIYTKINLDNGSGQGDYDEESKHRCDQKKQDEWNEKVKNGLPKITL